MKCITDNIGPVGPMQIHEPIKNLWEVRFAPEKTAKIINISQRNEITYSMTLRYCIFKLIETFNEISNEDEQYRQIASLADGNLNNVKLRQRKPIYDLKRYSVLDLKNYEEEDSRKMSEILDTIDKCREERSENNENAHRFMVCLYGNDEFLLRTVAARLQITVSLLFRVAAEMYLHELEPSQKVSDEMLLKYAIKQVLTTKFHNKTLPGSNNIGNFSITAIYFPQWKYWPISRTSDRYRD